MHVIAVNGSPRKKWNTATLLRHALEGAKSAGARTSLVHLYDLDYTGCVSCFACKKIGGESYGRCAVDDGLSPLLAEIADADALILGSPLYFRCESGEMRSFLERLLFPSLTYTPGYASIRPRKIPTALIYTMNMTEAALAGSAQQSAMSATREVMEHTFGACEMLLSTDTWQFTDYTKYLSTVFDPEAKARRREEVFPVDCARAKELGARLVAQAGS